MSKLLFHTIQLKDPSTYGLLTSMDHRQFIFEEDTMPVLHTSLYRTSNHTLAGNDAYTWCFAPWHKNYQVWTKPPSKLLNTCHST